MGPRSKIKKTRNTVIMKSKGKSSYYLYAALGICIACLPFLVVAAQVDDEQASSVEASDSMLESDLEAAESQNIGVAPQVAPVATIPIPAILPAPASVVPAASFSIPKTDLASAPSYAPRYSVPPVNPYRERLPYEVANFRRRATEDEERPPEDDYVPSESKGKKSSPSVLKRVRNTIRNTGKAIVGAPSYIYKRYRGQWKKYFGGGKKKKGWKSWTPSDKNDGGGWGGWEESEPSDGWEPSSYPPTDKGWKSPKGWGPPKEYDSNERRSDREPPPPRDRDDYYDRPARERTERPRDREKQRWASNYKEETHYDDYDGRRTTATYSGPARKSPKRPSGGGSGGGGGGSGYRYDEDY